MRKTTQLMISIIYISFGMAQIFIQEGWRIWSSFFIMLCGLFIIPDIDKEKQK